MQYFFSANFKGPKSASEAVGNEKKLTSYPAKDPPTHAKQMGANAGALPELWDDIEVDGGGEGLFRTAT